MKTIQLHLYKTHDIDLMQYDFKILAQEISNLITAYSEGKPYTVNISTKNIATKDIPEELVLKFELSKTVTEWLKRIAPQKRSSFIKELIRNNFKND